MTPNSGSRAEDNGATVHPASHHGNISGIVPWRFFLLVRWLVLLINHDKAEIAHRREYGRACANHNIRCAVMHPVPFVVSLAIRKMAVKHGNTVAETRDKSLHGLRRERNFRHKNDGALAAL